MVRKEYSPPYNPFRLYRDSLPCVADSESEAISRKDARNYALGALAFVGVIAVDGIYTVAGEVIGFANKTSSVGAALVAAASGAAMILMGRRDLKDAGPPNKNVLYLRDDT